MKILSMSDVITNSSSEVFCIIKADNEVLKEIYEVLDGVGESDWGDGGTWWNEEDSSIDISFSYTVLDMGLEKLLRAGIEKLLEPWKNKYSISYEDY